MTNEEAIEIIKSYKYEHAVGGYLKVNEAFDRAIKAFEFINENYPNWFEDYLKCNRRNFNDT